MSDLDNFHRKYAEKFGTDESSSFLLGNSLGGLISAFMASDKMSTSFKFRG